MRRLLFPPVTAFLVCALLWPMPLPVIGQYIFHGFTATGNTGATFTFVGAAKGNCSLATCSISYSPVNGNALCVSYGSTVSGATTAGGYDNGSSLYTTTVTDQTYNSSILWGQSCTCSVAGSPTAIGVALSGAPLAAAIIAVEYSYTGACIAASSVTSSLGSGTGTTITAGSLTTSTTNMLISGILLQVGLEQAVTPGTSYNDRDDEGFSGANTLTVLDRIVSSTGTYTANGTVGSGPTGWAAYTTGLP